MKPTVSQIRQALANHRQPSRTHGAKVRQTISGAKKSRAVNPAKDIYSKTTNGVTSAGRQRIRNAYAANYNPPK